MPDMYNLIGTFNSHNNFERIIIPIFLANNEIKPQKV